MTPDELQAVRERYRDANQAHATGTTGTPPNVEGLSVSEAMDVFYRSAADVPKLLDEVTRLTYLMGSHADGHLCSCTMTREARYYTYDGPQPAEWEQDPWCRTHPDMAVIMAEVDRLRAREARVERVLGAFIASPYAKLGALLKAWKGDDR